MKTRFLIFGLTTLFLTGCAQVLNQEGALALAPYHIEDNGRIIVEAQVNGQGPFSFALDSGASISAVFDDLSDKAELEPIPDKNVLVHGIGAAERLPLLNITSIQVGRELWDKPRIVLLPDKADMGDAIHGILGVDFLSKYAVGFSTNDRVVRLYPPDLVARKTYRGWASVPLTADFIGKSGAALYFFEVEINGQKITAVFDLGAGLNVINWPAARRLNVKPKGLRKGELISGVIENIPVKAQLKAKRVTTQNIHWRNEVFDIADLAVFRALMRDNTPAAILGVGLFNQRDFIIDFVRSRLLVKVAMAEADRPQ